MSIPTKAVAIVTNPDFDEKKSETPSGKYIKNNSLNDLMYFF